MEITCHAGYSGWDSPAFFTFEGCQLEVQKVLAEWREPVCKRWLVLAGGGHFQLELDNSGACSIYRKES